MDTSDRIANVAHFIWYGDRLPWVNALSMRSALERGGFERVILHHSEPVERIAHVAELAKFPAFELRPIDLHRVFAPFGRLGYQLAAVYARRSSPAARANVLRAAVLAEEGGVYLDMDTVTLRPFDSLLGAGVFCGEELVAFPYRLLRGRDPVALARALALHGVRAACRRLPDGVRLFQGVAHHYARALNNAVLGAAAGHPFMLAMLERMASMSRLRQRKRFALGTHLLQTLAAERPGDGLVVLPPATFYPLPPEISHHWFRVPMQVPLEEVISEQTRVVHWYASVENRALCERIDPAYVAAHRDRQLFSALAAPFVG